MEAPTSPPGTHPAARVLIGAVVAAAAGWGTLVAWFVGVVSWTGCFIGCGEPNRLLGVATMALAAALVGAAATAVGYAVVGWRRPALLRIWLIATGVGAMLGVASLAAS